MKLAFHKGAGILSVAIEYGTHSPYSHVELVFTDGVAFSARAEKTPAVNLLPFDGSDKLWDFVEIPSKYPEAPVRAWAQAQTGRGYDWAADIGFALPFLPDERNDLMCSGSCVLALQQDGIFPGFLAREVSPGQLYSMALVLAEASV